MRFTGYYIAMPVSRTHFYTPSIACVLAMHILFAPVVALAQSSYSETEEGFSTPELTTTDLDSVYLDMNRRYTAKSLSQWVRPPEANNALRVGIQVGHLKSGEVPAEFPGIRRNGAGTSYKNITEVSINHNIATRAAQQLRDMALTSLGRPILVDILPATIPAGYVADALVAIHADGNPNKKKRGFKVASPRRDFRGVSTALEIALRDAYSLETALPEDSIPTTNMRGYYAFNWQRFEHTIHPMTPAAIIEIGFMSNKADRDFLLTQDTKVARGIARGIIAFLSQSPEVARAQQESVRTPPRLPITGKPICLNNHLTGSIRTPNCVVGIETKREEQFALGNIASKISKKALLAASSITVTGDFSSISERKNYPWYIYDVDGVVQVESLQ